VSLRLSATRIFYLTQTVHKDFPAGAVFCEDAKGNWYRYKGPGHHDKETMRDPECWPNCVKGRISLWRDYWSVARQPSDKGAPYFDALYNAKIKVIK